MSEIKLTPIDQLEDLADGVPVLAVEGTVKYAKEITRSKPDAQHAWTKQFFVLGNDTASIACSLWDAEGSEVAKGEFLRIENTQNKKGQWTGMTKGSYQKDGERKHTLEIRANQVKISCPRSEQNNATQRDGVPKSYWNIETSEDTTHPEIDPDWPEAINKSIVTAKDLVQGKVPEAMPGVTEARKHIMQSANLYVLCIRAVEKYCAGHFPAIAQTSEQFQAATGTLFIEASRAGFVSKMPTSPME